MAADQEGTEKTHAQSSKRQIVWRNVILMFALHVGALYGIYLGVTAKRTTLIWRFYLFYHKRNKYPPGPLCLPVIGSLLWYLRQRSVKIRLAEALCASVWIYGNVQYVPIGHVKLVYLQGYKAVHEAFVKHADVLSNRPSPHRMQGQYEPKQGCQGVIWQNGDTQIILRKFTLKALRDFIVGKVVSLEDIILHEIDVVVHHFDNTAGKPTDIHMYTSKMVANIVFQIVFGKRFEYDDAFFDAILRRFDDVFNNGSVMDPSTKLPNVLLRLFNKHKLKEKLDHIENMKWIKAHIYKEIEAHELSYDKDNIRDFIDMFLLSKGRETEKDAFTVRNMHKTIMDLFYAGIDTTTYTFDWSILYMIEYPDVQRKCQDEILEKCGDRRIHTFDKAELPYVMATLSEIQRFANVGPCSLPHCSDTDTVINGHIIPKHTLIIANLYSCNIDPDYWDNPTTFNPDRFLDECGQLKRKQAFSPFSIGPRACIGEQLATMEMFLIFANLLQRYTFTREHEDVPNTLESVYDKVLCSPGDFKAKIIKRV